MSHLYYVVFAMCPICILTHLYFVASAMWDNCVLSNLHFVAAAFYHNCILSKLHFVAVAFWCCILWLLHFVLVAFCLDTCQTLALAEPEARLYNNQPPPTPSGANFSTSHNSAISQQNELKFCMIVI